MDENELRLSVAGFEPGDDVGLARLALGDVGEDFLVDETQGLEVEAGPRLGLFFKEDFGGVWNARPSSDRGTESPAETAGEREEEARKRRLPRSW